MKQSVETILSGLREGLSMTQEERAAIKARLLARLAKIPLAETPSDWAVREPEVRRLPLLSSPWMVAHLLSTIKILKPMPLALIIALMLGGTVSVAADNTVPGNFLYPFKIAVNEEVRGAFAFSVKSKAKVEADLAERRLEEAEKLAAKWKLDAKTSTELKTAFAARTEALKERVEELRAQGDSEAALGVSAGFEAALKAHSRIVERLENRAGTSTGEISGVNTKIKAQILLSAAERARIESRIASTTVVRVEQAAEGKMKAAENKLAEVKKFIENKKDSVSASAYAEASVQIASAAKTFADAKVALSGKHYGEAFVLFETAMREAQSAKMVVTDDKKERVEHSGTATSTAGVSARVKERDDDDSGTTPDADERRDGGADGRNSEREKINIRTESKTEVKTETRVDGDGDHGKAEERGTVKSEGNIRVNIGL